MTNHSAFRFDEVVKLPAVLSDLGIVYLMYRYSRDRFGPCWWTLIPALLFAFDPVVLLISAGHGQFDSLVIFFLLLALYLRGRAQTCILSGARCSSGLPSR